MSELEKLKKALTRAKEALGSYTCPDTKWVQGRIIEIDPDAGPLYERYQVPATDGGHKARTTLQEIEELLR